MSKDHVQDSVREEFRKLSLDAKTAFLVEAIFSTAGSAINEIGSRLNNLVSLVSDPLEGAGEDSAPEPEKAKADETESAEPSSSKAKSAKTDGSGSGSGKSRSSKK